jgi:hypothetical protein
VRASPRLREAMDQADIFRLVLSQNSLSSDIVKSRICDGSPAGLPYPGRFSHGLSLNSQCETETNCSDINFDF